MNSFWTKIYDDCKDRRYGALFLVTVFICWGLLIAGMAISAITGSNHLQEFLMALAPGIIIFAVAAVASGWRWIRGRKRRREQLKYSALSRDELAKARSKLKNQMKPIKIKEQTKPAGRAVSRAPDTNLKY
jgi:membrane protein implicated in regulation of membrane protease activity